MPRTKNKTTIDKLPPDAMTVTEYANKVLGKHKSLVYHLITRDKANYTIKVFQGINFVIPN